MSYTRYLAAYLPAADESAPASASTLPILVVTASESAKTATVGSRLPVAVVGTATVFRTAGTGSTLPIGSVETSTSEKVGAGAGALPVMVVGTSEVTQVIGYGPPARGTPRLTSYSRRPAVASYSGRVTVH